MRLEATGCSSVIQAIQADSQVASSATASEPQAEIEPDKPTEFAKTYVEEAVDMHKQRRQGGDVSVALLQGKCFRKLVI